MPFRKGHSKGAGAGASGNSGGRLGGNTAEAQSEGALHGPARRKLTRRRFVGGAAAGAATLAAISLVGCTDGSSSEGSEDTTEATGEPQVITDESQVVDVTDEYENVDTEFTATYTWTLPLGTVLFHSEGSWCAAMFAPESALYVNTLGVVSIAEGTTATLVEEPLNGSGYDFYDVRCGSGVFAWVEENFLTCDWMLIAQEFSEGALVGDPVELDSGDEDWEPAKFATTGSSVIWLKMPLASGDASTENSHCYRWTVGSSSGKELYESPGRFATAPRVSDGILTITPRVNASEGTYYGLTAMDLADASVTERLVMPSSVKPFEATYMNGQFAFSVEANYDSGGALGNMGSYLGNEGGPFITLSREPLACVVGKGTQYYIKVKSSHYVVDTDAETYAVLSAPSNTMDYGDYPASEGTTDQLVTYATLRGDDGAPESVCMRVFDL